MGDGEGTEVPVEGGTIRTEAARDAAQGEAGFGAQYAQATLPKGELHQPVPAPGLGDGDWRSRWPALKSLLVAAGTFVGLALLAYVVPGMENFRPWVPGEPAPMAKLLFLKTGDAVGGPGEGPMSPEQAQAAAEGTLGKDLAKNLTKEVLAAGEDGELADVPEPHAGITISPEEIEGLVREIEDPSGRALDAFYAALARTAQGREGAITRIAHWGDSTIAADDVTGTLRRRFQKRFGDAGHGFLLVGKGTLPYRHKDVEWDQPKTWNVQSCISDERKDGRYGYGGILQRGGRGAKAPMVTVEKGRIGLAMSRFELWYQAHPDGGTIDVTVDGGAPQAVPTKAQATEDRWFKVDLPDGPHQVTLKVAGGGDARVYGVSMERGGPGVVYDSLGIVGARANRLLNLDPAHLGEQVRYRSPDLLVIAFGGNEAGDERMNMEKYREGLAKVVRAVRAGRPEASCLLMAPLDQGEVGPRGGVRTMPTIPKIVESQRQVAAEEGCAFFDTWKAMGGNGAMGRWYKSRPRLGWGDYRHASPAGYEVIGNLFYKALLKGFTGWLARSAAAAPAAASAP